MKIINSLYNIINCFEPWSSEIFIFYPKLFLQAGGLEVPFSFEFEVCLSRKLRFQGCLSEIFEFDSKLFLEAQNTDKKNRLRRAETSQASEN